MIICFLLGAVSLNCSKDECFELYGLEPFLFSGNVILIGEMHGTQEAPHFIEQMACHALEKHIPVTIFLELPQTDQEKLNLFLNSNGSDKFKHDFLSLNFWSRSYQDGRASAAMFELINSIRILKQKRQNIDIVFIDNQRAPNRDFAMAERMVKEIERVPNNIFISLTGNMHARISDGSGAMGSYILKKIGKEKLVSLNQSFSGGTAWVCLMNEGCGPVALKGSGSRDIGVFLNSSSNHFNGILAMDSIHASFPAKDLFNNSQRN